MITTTALAESYQQNPLARDISLRGKSRTTTGFLGAVTRGLLICAVIATAAACGSDSSSSPTSNTNAPAGITMDPTLTAAPTTTAQPTSTTIQPSPIETLITEVLQTHRDAGEFVGARISVMTDDGVITEATAGTQTTDPASAPVALDVPWGVGSVTKSFVAVVVLQLAEEGELDLDASIIEYFPNLVGAEQITPRQLLQHTSGLGEYINDPLVRGEAQREWTPGELIAVAESSGRVGAPGGASLYSNTNYIMLGEIIEQVTGAPWIDAVQARIIEPLGITSTSLIDDDSATGYSIVDTEFVETTFQLHPSIGGAAGVLESTNHDLLRFATAMVDGTLLTPSSLTAVQAFVPGEDYSSFGIVHSRGLGLERYQNDVITVIGHLGTGGAHSAFFGLDVATRTAVVVMMNTANPGPQAVMAVEVLTAMGARSAMRTTGMTSPAPLTPDGNLQDTLEELLGTGPASNPALNRLLDDYATYHAMLVVVGGCFLLALLLFTGFCWKQYRRSRAGGAGTRSFERRAYARLGLLSVTVSALLAVVVAANLSNALDARQGFSGIVPTLGSPPAGSSRAELQLEFSTWLQSADANTPPAIEDRIDDRLAWQQPKAIITGVLLVLIAALSAHAWRGLLRASRVNARPWAARDRARLAAAIGSVPVCLLLMLMVMGNTQASVAPLTMTMLFG